MIKIGTPCYIRSAHIDCPSCRQLEGHVVTVIGHAGMYNQIDPPLFCYVINTVITGMTDRCLQPIVPPDDMNDTPTHYREPVEAL